ncbi:hypothetical protein Tco_0094873 [Tanacetum coccineum]
MVDVAPRCPTSRELDYGIMNTWDDLVGAINEIALTTLKGVNQRVTDFSTVVEQETTIIVIVSRSQKTKGDYRVIGIRPQETGLAQPDAPGEAGSSS